MFQVCHRPFVVNHIENPSVFPKSLHKEAFSSHNVTDASHNEVHASNLVENGITKLEQEAGRGAGMDDILHVSIS